jgi:hypothetical protein
MAKGRMVTKGARDLRAYMNRNGMNLPEFCEQHGLDRINVKRILDGERQRITVDFALAIERATGGEVRWKRWASETASPADKAA